MCTWFPLHTYCFYTFSCFSIISCKQLREIVSDCMSTHMRKYYELVEQLNIKNAELEREKKAKILIYNQLQQEQRENAILKKQLEEKDKRVKLVVAVRFLIYLLI